MPEYIPLAFGLEAIFPPMALPSNQLRNVYMKLADPCRFSEFRQLGEGQGARLAEGNNRHLTLATDRLIYRDDFTQAMFDTFAEDIDRVLTTLREVFHLPVLLHSKVLIRLLMPYQGQGNTVEYFHKTIANAAASHLDCFQRPSSGVGMRLVFPPTQELHSTFNLRIEPYMRDVKMFFLENSAQFFDPVVNFGDMRQHLSAGYEFVKEKAGPFVLSLSSHS